MVSEEKNGVQPQHQDHLPTIVRDPFTIESSNPVINQEHSLTSEIDIKEEPLSDNENEVFNTTYVIILNFCFLDYDYNHLVVIDHMFIC